MVLICYIHIICHGLTNFCTESDFLRNCYTIVCHKTDDTAQKL